MTAAEQQNVTQESITTRWRFDPPVVVPRKYREGNVAIHILECTRYTDDREVYWVAKGTPLTKKGNPNGVIDWRPLSDDVMATLKDLVS